MKYFSQNDYTELQGLDLKIDSSITKICEVSNSSSSSSRRVLYILLIVAITSFIAVINTIPEKPYLFNWSSERIGKSDSMINVMEHRLADSFKNKRNQFDSIKLRLDLESRKKINDILKRTDIDNNQVIHIPIIGNAFDVNDLSVFAGLSFIIILSVLLVTIRRERKNLRIALHAVTERYPDPEEYLDDYSQKIDVLPASAYEEFKNSLDPGDQYTKEFVSKFNLTRRRYHYNFLSMNEIFTVPYDALRLRREKKLSRSFFKDSTLGKIVINKIFYFPYWVYLVIVLNDIMSFADGEGLSKKHAFVASSLSLIFLNTIAYLCYLCTLEKKTIQKCYDLFIRDGAYKFIYWPAFESSKSTISLINLLFYYSFKIFIDGFMSFGVFGFKTFRFFYLKNKPISKSLIGTWIRDIDNGQIPENIADIRKMTFGKRVDNKDARLEYIINKKGEEKKRQLKYWVENDFYYTDESPRSSLDGQKFSIESGRLVLDFKTSKIYFSKNAKSKDRIWVRLIPAKQKIKK